MSHLPLTANPAPGNCLGSRRLADPPHPDGHHTGVCPVCWTHQPLIPLTERVADHRPNVPNA